MKSLFLPNSKINLSSGKVDTGTLYIIVIILVLAGFAFLITGPTPSQNLLPGGTEVVIGPPKQENAKAQLQLYSFSGATITPPMSSICQKGAVNTNPELIIATYPANGNAVRSNGQIKAWLNDTKPVKIAPNENIRRSSGFIISPGDRAAKAPDNYIWEPALYIMPNSADTNGRAYFPNLMHGLYNNNELRLAYGADPLPASVVYKDKGTSLELVWSVKDLGIGPGEYQIQIVAHDGNDGRGVKCFTIRVYDPPDLKTALPN